MSPPFSPPIEPSSFPNTRLRNPKIVQERNTYRRQPRRSPRKHSSSIAIDAKRRQLTKWRSLYIDHHRDVAYLITKSGYPIYQRRTGM